MNVMDVMQRVKAGERVIVSLPSREGCERKYSLSDGTAVSSSQFAKLVPFLRPADAGLIGDIPQSYEWDN